MPETMDRVREAPDVGALVERAKVLLLIPDYSQKAHADMIRELVTALSGGEDD